MSRRAVSGESCASGGVKFFAVHLCGGVVLQEPKNVVHASH